MTFVNVGGVLLPLPDPLPEPAPPAGEPGLTAPPVTILLKAVSGALVFDEPVPPALPPPGPVPPTTPAIEPKVPSLGSVEPAAGVPDLSPGEVSSGAFLVQPVPIMLAAVFQAPLDPVE